MTGLSSLTSFLAINIPPTNGWLENSGTNLKIRRMKTAVKVLKHADIATPSAPGSSLGLVQAVTEHEVQMNLLSILNHQQIKYTV